MGKQDKSYRFMNPYLAGVGLGLTLLASFLILGAGLGASAGIARLAACMELCIARSHTLASEYFGRWGDAPLRYYLVFMLAGVFLGSLFSAVLSNRIDWMVERGRRCTVRKRVILAFAGGLLVGFASRMANGCTSGQALTGSALMLTGSFVFMLCLFLGGYLTAWFVRRQWND